jgi:hypothetical protein
VDPVLVEALKQPYETLQRYAGWLDRERTCGLVRADVQALGAAIETDADPSALLQSLDVNIGRLPGGDLRKMLRIAAGEMRRMLAGTLIASSSDQGRPEGGPESC